MNKKQYADLMESISFSISSVLNENNIDSKEKSMYEQDKLENETWKQMADRVGFTAWYKQLGRHPKDIGNSYMKARQRWLISICKDPKVIKNAIEANEKDIDFYNDIINDYYNSEDTIKDDNQNDNQNNEYTLKIEQLETDNKELLRKLNLLKDIIAENNFKMCNFYDKNENSPMNILKDAYDYIIYNNGYTSRWYEDKYSELIKSQYQIVLIVYANNIERVSGGYYGADKYIYHNSEYKSNEISDEYMNYNWNTLHDALLKNTGIDYNLKNTYIWLTNVCHTRYEFIYKDNKERTNLANQILYCNAPKKGKKFTIKDNDGNTINCYQTSIW